MRLGVLLTPGFLEAEAALVLEIARLLEMERFTVARGRTALEGSAGAVWTPKYTFAARPELDALVIPGGPQMSKLGRDGEHQDWLGEVWGGLRASFTGANGVLMLLEAGLVSGKVSAHPVAREALEGSALELTDEPAHWRGKVCTTRGYLELGRAMLDWAGFSDEARAHLGL